MPAATEPLAPAQPFPSTIEEVVAFLESQPAGATYTAHDGRSCPLAALCKARGITNVHVATFAYVEENLWAELEVMPAALSNLQRAWMTEQHIQQRRVLDHPANLTRDEALVVARRFIQAA